MKGVIRLILLTSLAGALAGCSDNKNDRNSVSQASYTAHLTAIEVANTDTGELVGVDGLPAQGDEIIKD
ncbi:MAG: hypothetical protein OEV14_08435 [Gammaproteobacteria bacterium]|nr:hypothetical protein [Gammaproteobacteria bacterium]